MGIREILEGDEEVDRRTVLATLGSAAVAGCGSRRREVPEPGVGNPPTRSPQKTGDDSGSRTPTETETETETGTETETKTDEPRRRVVETDYKREIRNLVNDWSPALSRGRSPRWDDINVDRDYNDLKDDLLDLGDDLEDEDWYLEEDDARSGVARRLSFDVISANPPNADPPTVIRAFGSDFRATRQSREIGRFLDSEGIDDAEEVVDEYSDIDLLGSRVDEQAEDVFEAFSDIFPAYRDDSWDDFSVSRDELRDNRRRLEDRRREVRDYLLRGGDIFDDIENYVSDLSEDIDDWIDSLEQDSESTDLSKDQIDRSNDLVPAGGDDNIDIGYDAPQWVDNLEFIDESVSKLYSAAQSRLVELSMNYANIENAIEFIDRLEDSEYVDDDPDRTPTPTDTPEPTDTPNRDEEKYWYTRANDLRRKFWGNAPESYQRDSVEHLTNNGLKDRSVSELLDVVGNGTTDDGEVQGIWIEEDDQGYDIVTRFVYVNEDGTREVTEYEMEDVDEDTADYLIDFSEQVSEGEVLDEALEKFD